MKRCQVCRDRRPRPEQAEVAEWAWQPLGPGEKVAETFATLGSFYRGFPVINVCDSCKTRIQESVLEDGDAVFFHYRKVSYVTLRNRVEETPF